MTFLAIIMGKYLKVSIAGGANYKIFIFDPFFVKFREATPLYLLKEH